MRFTDMHSPSAVCTPTRYGLLTGRYCWRTSLKRGVLNGYSPNLIEAGRPTLATLLKSRGYHTACVGKWHLGLGSEAKADFSGRSTPIRPITTSTSSSASPPRSTCRPISTSRTTGPLNNPC